jgi:hypothetical protein
VPTASAEPTTEEAEQKMPELNVTREPDIREPVNMSPFDPDGVEPPAPPD